MNERGAEGKEDGEPMSKLRAWIRALSRGAGYITLDPSPRLRRLRGAEEAKIWRPGFGPLPPLPDSAYPPDAVPLDTSGPARSSSEGETMSDA